MKRVSMDPKLARARAGLAAGAAFVLLAALLLPILARGAVAAWRAAGFTPTDLLAIALVGLFGGLVVAFVAAAVSDPARERGGRPPALLLRATLLPRPAGAAWIVAAAAYGATAFRLPACDPVPVQAVLAAVGAAVASTLLAIATFLGLWREEEGEEGEREVAPPPTPAGPPEPPPLPDLLGWIRAHTGYRGELERPMPARPTGSAEDDPPPELPATAHREPTASDVQHHLEHAPLLAAAPHAEEWSASQWEAAEAVAIALSPRATHRTVALTGWPGAGVEHVLVGVLGAARTTHRWLSLLVAPDAETLDRLCERTGHRRIAADTPSELPDPGDGPGLGCTAAAFASLVAPRLLAHPPGWLWRLSAAVLLDIHRLDRAALLHLAEATRTLRVALACRGRDVAVITTSIPLDNATALAEFLANRTDGRTVRLDRPAPAHRLLVWRSLPGLEPSVGSLGPRPLRAAVEEAAVDLCRALREAGGREEPSLLLWDPTAALSPEAWEATRARILSGAKGPTRVQPRLAVQVGGFPLAPRTPHDAVLVTAPPSPPVEAVHLVRGWLAPGGTIVLLETPGRPLLRSAVESAVGTERVHARLPPAAPADLLTVRWRSLIERLPGGAVVERGRLEEACGRDAWRAILELARNENIDLREVRDHIFVADATGAPRLAEALFRPADWPVAAAERLPWGAVTLDRLPVHNTGASAPDLPGSGELDRFRLFVDWIPGTTVPSARHSLRVEPLRAGGHAAPDGRIEVATPNEGEGMHGRRSRACREVALLGFSGNPASLDLRTPDRRVALRAEKGPARVRERLLGFWTSGPAGACDPRLVGAPTLYDAPLEREFDTWAARLRWEDGAGRPPPPEALEAMLRAWWLEVAERWWRPGFEIAATVLLDDEGGPCWLLYRRLPSTEPLPLHSTALPGTGADLAALRDAIARRLAGCGCLDGCAACGLLPGDVPAALVERAPDLAALPGRRTSRRAALHWLSGRDPATPRPANPRLLVAELVGAEDAPGLLPRLLDGRHGPGDAPAADRLAADVVALARRAVGATGGAELTRAAGLALAAHALAHRWQRSGGGRFDARTWQRAPAARALAEGQLVAEAHALWVEGLVSWRVAGDGMLVELPTGALHGARALAWRLADTIVHRWGLEGWYRYLAGPRAWADEPPPSRTPHPWPPGPPEDVLPELSAQAGMHGPLCPLVEPAEE